MFLQVEIRAEDCEYLRFLWQFADWSFQTYRYNNHIVGAKSSPTCANFALQKCARVNADDFVLASHIVQNKFYMGDLIVSVDAKEEMVIIKKDHTDMLTNGGFKLTK